ncbi:MAG TPA: hypothetical protein VFZ65_12410 [Planctomycetota bacterium]|nr:hypothetical protein [Planctomycetota bacterium]
MPTLRALLFLLPLAACQTGPSSSIDGTQPPQPAPAAQQAPAKDPDEATKLEKELRQKQRELDEATAEQRINELAKQERERSVATAAERAADDKVRAAEALKVFQDDERPRELEEKQLELDQSTYRAEHQKDELGELTAMYENDEFAAATKELVLKRGRRELEVAERRLALAKKSMRHAEQVEMPRRERELRRKLADAEIEHEKAQLAAKKAALELDLAQAKAEHRLTALKEEIEALQAKLAKAKEAK